MSEFRSVMITGGAIADYMGEKKKGGKKGERRTKKSQEGGTVINVAPFTNPVPSIPVVPVQGAQIQQPQQPQQLQHAVVIPKTGGEIKHVKVELKKKHLSHKVKLQPKKDEPKKKHKVHKTRRFSIGVSQLHKRITRAKKVHKNIKNMSLDKLKELLISKKLIKSTSKAPESVLRQIAADSQIVDKNAL